MNPVGKLAIIKSIDPLLLHEKYILSCSDVRKEIREVGNNFSACRYVMINIFSFFKLNALYVLLKDIAGIAKIVGYFNIAARY